MTLATHLARKATGVSAPPALDSSLEKTMSAANLRPSVHIGNVIRNAVVFNFRTWREKAVNTDNLPQTVARLFALLKERQVEYLLVGGVALLNYVEGRNTEDIDLIMALPALKKLPEIEGSVKTMILCAAGSTNCKLIFCSPATRFLKAYDSGMRPVNLLPSRRSPVRPWKAYCFSSCTLYLRSIVRAASRASACTKATLRR